MLIFSKALSCGQLHLVLIHDYGKFTFYELKFPVNLGLAIQNETKQVTHRCEILFDLIYFLFFNRFISITSSGLATVLAQFVPSTKKKPVANNHF